MSETTSARTSDRASSAANSPTSPAWSHSGRPCDLARVMMGPSTSALTRTGAPESSSAITRAIMSCPAELTLIALACAYGVAAENPFTNV